MERYIESKIQTSNSMHFASKTLPIRSMPLHIIFLSRLRTVAPTIYNTCFFGTSICVEKHGHDHWPVWDIGKPASRIRRNLYSYYLLIQVQKPCILIYQMSFYYFNDFAILFFKIFIILLFIYIYTPGYRVYIIAKTNNRSDRAGYQLFLTEYQTSCPVCWLLVTDILSISQFTSYQLVSGYRLYNRPDLHSYLIKVDSISSVI
jgi:hypothetical protein